MVSKKGIQKTAIVLALALIMFGVVAPFAFAAEGAEGAAGAVDGLKAAGIAIGAGIALAGAALGTGRAQGAIGAAGTAAITEKPDMFGRVFILVALPETMLVFGFVVALLIMRL